MTTATLDYQEFLKAKVCVAGAFGFDVADSDVSPILKPHQRAMVRWMVAGGRRACFAAFGLGKSIIQLESVRLTRERAGGRGLIVLPLGVRTEFVRDAAMIGVRVKFIRRIEEADPDEAVLCLTNYETIRDGKIDPKAFTVVSLDEASVLRGFGGTKTFREFMRVLAGDGGRGPSESKPNSDRYAAGGVPYRFVATATPSPNEYIELLAYSAFLGVLDVSQAKTRFFKRDSTKADTLTLHPHKEREFWLWLASWALFVQRPSDLDPSFSDEGYVLPPLDVRWHEIPSDHTDAGQDSDGQRRMYRDASIGVTDASREKRDSLGGRIAKMMELRAEDPGAHRIIWHDLECERRAIEAAVPGAVSVFGSQDLDEREKSIVGFANGEIAELAGKPQMLGSGCNFQRHCAWSIFLGIGFKFNDFIQAVHRVYRFLQTKQVRIDLIYTDAERTIRQRLEEKWSNHVTMVAKMTDIIQEYGLAQAALAAGLARSMGVKRVEVAGPTYRLVNADAIEEARTIEPNSVHLVVTSIPFSTQYEYTPSYNDLGHTDNDDHFFEHLSFLTPELLRILQPGRVAAIHVKDRIVPGGLTGLGFQTVSPFSDHTISHFRKHGFAFLGRKTVVTDVVRENNQTYRLGWTEQCKDGSRMGNGMPEYVLLFRKPPTDPSKGYADVPVVKSKEKYSRSRWQIDAHGFMRSDGNRPLLPEDLAGLPHEQIYKLYRDFSLDQVYDFEHHVKVGEALEQRRRLPVTFMLLPPQSWHPDVWTDVARMRTLNAQQERKGQEMHLCPLQFDIVDRLIAQFSQPGEVVLDPFGGLMTVPYCAVRQGRFGRGIELNAKYFADGVAYVAAAAREASMPTLFDALEPEVA